MQTSAASSIQRIIAQASPKCTLEDLLPAESKLNLFQHHEEEAKEKNLWFVEETQLCQFLNYA